MPRRCRALACHDSRVSQCLADSSYWPVAMLIRSAHFLCARRGDIQSETSALNRRDRKVFL